MMNKFDLYIIKKFFSTFLFTLTIILLIVVIFDISEKIDDFLEHNLRINSIIKEYYLHFIPYFANLFSPLFIFISVIFFTSRMAENNEIIAILNSGMSFVRFLKPFIISAIFFTCFSFVLSNFIIPYSNQYRIDFENKYLRNKKHNKNKNIHLQILPEEYVYLESFNTNRNIAYKFTLEEFEDSELKRKLKADYAQFDSINQHWSLNNYEIREFKNEYEEITKGKKINVNIKLSPKDLLENNSIIETMNFYKLNNHIKNEELKGKEQVIYYKIEKQKRIAFPFATIILTLIAVAISSNKIRGGMGVHLGIGILITFTYILFMQISTTFSTNSNLAPVISVWIPNFIFGLIAVLLLRKRII